MRVLVIGSGGREHALAAKLAQSPLVEKVYCAPGNGGTQTVAENVPLAVDDIESLAQFARQNAIGLAVPGPELPLTLGIADALKNAGIPCFGPDTFCAQLEGSKSFAKEIMARANVPTAKSSVFTSLTDARKYLEKNGAPAVIKADGLAAGKGVVVANTLEEALSALEHVTACARDNPKILIEEKLEGEEVSLLCLCDGETAIPLPSAQDHKTVFDGDTGPNTGGMGAYSPAPALPDSQLEQMADLVIRPVLRELARMGHPFRGVLYAGLMLTGNGPKVLEYNVRFGDPECQAILPRMQSDLAAHMLAATKGQLQAEKPAFTQDACCGIVLAARGYPAEYSKGMTLTGIDAAEKLPKTSVFHSGTKRDCDSIKSSGGRVLCVTSLGKNLEEARNSAYAALDKIRMENSHYRKDIGLKGLNR